MNKIRPIKHNYSAAYVPISLSKFEQKTCKEMLSSDWRNCLWCESYEESLSDTQHSTYHRKRDKGTLSSESIDLPKLRFEMGLENLFS